MSPFRSIQHSENLMSQIQAGCWGCRAGRMKPRPSPTWVLQARGSSHLRTGAGRAQAASWTLASSMKAGLFLQAWPFPAEANRCPRDFFPPCKQIRCFWRIPGCVSLQEAGFYFLKPFYPGARAGVPSGRKRMWWRGMVFRAGRGGDAHARHLRPPHWRPARAGGQLASPLTLRGEIALWYW